jgi:hypothetical protein
MVSRVNHLFAYDFKCEVHPTPVQKVFQDSFNSEQVHVLWFCGNKYLHQPFPFPPQTIYPPLHSLYT